MRTQTLPFDNANPYLALTLLRNERIAMTGASARSQHKDTWEATVYSQEGGHSCLFTTYCRGGIELTPGDRHANHFGT